MPLIPSVRRAAGALLLLSLLPSGSVFADVSVPAFFGSGMVLQREAPLRIWGKASPGEDVVVELGSEGAAKVATRADADGRWRVELPARGASAEPLTLTVRGKNELRFDGVLVGDVWLCSGQSNMNFRLKQADGGAAEVAAAAFPGIRLFTVAREVADEPRDDVKGRWLACSPASAGDFSAVGYFFGKRIHREIGVPVGLIHSSWGGTAAEAWTPRATLAASDETRPILERWDATMANFPRIQAEFEANRERLVTEWKVKVAEAKQTGRTPPAEPRLRTGPGTQYQPAGLYHAMIAPLVGLPIRGVIWYQGEANATRAAQYRTLFPAMIGAWREAWGRADLPFLFVQLPNIDRQPEPSRSGWAELREAQLRTLALPHTGMAVTIDVGDPKDLHPTNKFDVGNRLALVAEAVVYGRPAAGRLSPVFERAEPDGARLRVYLKTHDGLAVRGGGIDGGGDGGAGGGAEPKGFTVAGADQVFHPARACIEGDGVVVVSSDAVAAPVAVRYAWADNPDANLTGGSGLPASPFRSDDWPAVTTGKR